MTLEDQAQTIRFFEGMGKPLSTREIEILLEDEEDRSNTFLFGDGKEGGFEGLTDLSNEIEILVQEQEDQKRMCAECRYFHPGRFSAYCYEFHRPREVTPGTLACEWSRRRG